MQIVPTTTTVAARHEVFTTAEEAAFDHLREHCVQPTDRPRPSRAELVMTTRQQPQDLPMSSRVTARRFRCRNATIAADRASCTSVLSLWPESNNRARADSAAGTSTTVSPDDTS